MRDSAPIGMGAAPAQKRLAYVIRDFNIKDGLKDNLIATRSHFEKREDAGVRVEFSDPSTPAQGEIWSNIVRPKLDEAFQVIAFVDKPNANVGFEIGYALGRGSRDPKSQPAIVALALHAKEAPEWLKQPPFAGFNAVQFKDEKALIATIDKRSGFSLSEPVELGDELVFLCPESGGKYQHVAEEVGKWRTFSGSGWALKDLPKRLAGIGGLVWMIPPTVDERDGPENAALSVVAGFAKACGIEVKTLLHCDAREPLDIVPEALRVSDLDAFEKMIAKLHEDLRRNIAEAARSVSTSAAVEHVPRPHVGDRPVLPHTAELKDRFIGRQRWLEDFYGALEGLRERWMRSLPFGRNPVQLFWYHGLGGMGKTTLVRKAMLDAAERFPEARVAYWEWDQDNWRKPLYRAPDSAEDVSVAVAHRLAQLYGVEALDPYWRAEARVKSAAAQAIQAKARFHNEYNDWLVKSQASPALRLALHALDLLRSKRELVEDEHSRAFRRWIDEGGFEFKDQEASLDGARLRRDALLSSLTRLCQEAPLLMVFDTCEVLSADADEALRSLLVEVCDRRKPVLVMMASRLAPDVGVVPGSKDTWRDSLGDDRLKIERFDDLTLTTTEIEQYLRRFDPSLEAPEQLARELHRITLGVPLALRVLVEMEGGLAFIPNELAASKEEAGVTVSRENALYELYERLAARFLIHVHDEKDLNSILSLAIATDANQDLLVAYWGGRASWSERVRNLARRFSLLVGGDLHPVVRGHLRRSLRAGKYHQNTKEIAEALAKIATRTPETPAFDDRYFQQKIGIVNLQTWTAEEPSTLDIAPGMALAMAYEQRLDSWISLAAELAEAKQQSPGRSLLLELQHLISVEGRSLSYRDFLPRHRWMTVLSAAHLEKYFEWLGIAERNGEWSKEEKTALHILRALHARDAPDALPCFVKALEHVESGAIPLLSQVGEALFESARRAWLQDRGSADVATSLRLALRVNYQSRSAHAALGEYFLFKSRYGDAHKHYAAASELEPNNPSHLVNLTNLFRLQRAFVDAVSSVDKALAIDAGYPWAHNQRGLIAQDQKQYDGAIAAFEKAHELDRREPVFPHNLADCYRQQKQYGKASEWVDKTLAIQSDYPSAYDQRGLIAQDQKQYDGAIAAFEKAHELDRREPAFPNNLADCYRQPKQYGTASEWVDKTLTIQSDYAWAHNQRGLIARDQKQYDGAIAAFEKAHELDPHEPVFPNNLADCYRQQKQYGKASEWVDKTLAIQSDYPSAYNQRGLIARDQKQYDGAIAAFEKAHELDPGEAEFAYSVGWNLLEELKYAESEAWAGKAIQLDREHVGAQNLLGAIAYARRRWADAQQIFRRLAATASSEPALACNVARACMRLGQFVEAQEQVSVALQIDSEHPSAYQLLATLHHLRDSPEAAELAKRAVNLEQSFAALLVFALTRPASNPPEALDDPIGALRQALDKASPLDRELDFDFVIYALRVLEKMYGAERIREAVLGNTSPVWETLRQAITYLDQRGAPAQGPVVAAVVAAMSAPVPPKEQLLAAWAAGQS
jgi:tetratricopeptide (TPR) repeat protein